MSKRNNFKTWHFPKFRIALAIGAHPDDIEMGCAGTLARLQDMGADIHCIVMSICEEEHSKDESEIRKKEFEEASSLLGAKTNTAYNFPNRELPAQSVKMMDLFSTLRDELKPELILIPWMEDSHQDHCAVAYAAIRSFRKNETIIQYEILRYGSHTFTPNLFVNITKYIENKIRQYACLKCTSNQKGV